MIDPANHSSLRMRFQDSPGSAAAAAAWELQAAAGAPVSALLGFADLMFSAGGSRADDLKVWEADSYTVLFQANCEVYGSISCLTLMPWAADAAGSAAAAGKTMAAEAVVGHDGSAGSSSSNYDCWGLLSGHGRGQVVMWQLRRPNSGTQTAAANAGHRECSPEQASVLLLLHILHVLTPYLTGRLSCCAEHSRC